MGGICSCCPCFNKVAPVEKPVTPRPPEEPIISRPPEKPSRAPFSNTGISKSNPLTLIRGFEHEPLVSLEEALDPFHGKIDHLSYHIKEAKTKCHHPSEHGLTRDESAAIYIYTMRWDKDYLYDHLQAAWASNNPLEMKPWFKYLKLFKSAFDKLPDAKGEIWKGKSYDENLKEELDAKSASLYTAMDLFEPSKASIEKSLHNRGVKEMILLGFKSINGKLVHKYAANYWNGILVFPGAKLGISNMEVLDETGSVIFHLTGPILIDEPLEKPPTIEKHYFCPNDRYNCSGFTEHSTVARNDLFYLIVHEIIE